MSHELTEGQKAVGLTFNPSNNPAVDAIKQKCAEIIDEIDVHLFQAESGEAKAQLTLAKRRIQEGQMWAVKGVTWPY